MQIADYTAAILLLGGIATALYARERTGVGQEVEVSLLGAGITIQNNVFGQFDDYDDWRSEFLAEVLPRAREERWSLEEIDAARSALRSDPRNTDFYRVFRTRDGEVAVGAGSQRLVEKLLSALGIDSAAADRAQSAAKVEAMLAEMRTEDVIDRLRQQEIPSSSVHHIEELLEDSHVEAEELVLDLVHPKVGRYRSLGKPIRMSRNPFQPARSSPEFAEHTGALLAELGFTSSEVDQLVASGTAVLGGGSTGGEG